MNLRDLAYLVAVAEVRHFGRAAALSHVSQPTLSGQIRKLEDDLGIVLFERDSRNVTPTAAGEAVLAEARAALAHAAAIRDIAAAHRDPLSGGFRLGVIASLGPFLAPDLLMAAQRDAPRLAITLVEGLTDDLLAALRAHDLDAALVASAPDGDDLQAVEIFEEPFLLGHAPGHPLAEVDAPDLRGLDAGTLLLLAEGHCLRDQALSLCDATSVDARVKATSLTTLMRLAAAGAGVTLVPALAAGSIDGLALRPLADTAARRTIRLLARRNFPRIGALEAIAAAAQSIAGDRGLTPVRDRTDVRGGAE